MDFAENNEMEWNEPGDDAENRRVRDEIPAEINPPAAAQNGERIPRIDDDVLDGGMPPGITKQKTTECDLILYFQCPEYIEDYPDHAILAPDVTVAIGLDKTTKLGAVFGRYIEFCNEHSKTGKSVDVEQLEFVHCSLLDPSDTAEASALMKNDRINVQRIRKAERDAAIEQHRMQVESDRYYFDTLRGLMPDVMGACDIVLDCRGKLVDENGLNQELLRTQVRGHSAILTKRSKWLGDLIARAKDELERKSVITIPETENGCEGQVAKQAESDDGDDSIEVLHYPVVQQQGGPLGATEIENDDDEDMLVPASGNQSNQLVSGVSARSNVLWVPVAHHPPHSLKLLLEYCYTNRVVPLGRHAFEAACSPVNSETGSAVAPPTSQWAHDGEPTVSFQVALAGISLAEEACMPRLSLMCEVAAARLIGTSNIVEALSACSTQEKLTGNSLSRLREAAMCVVLGGGQRGVSELYRTPTFQRALEEKSEVVVPTLLEGTTDLMSRSSSNLRKDDSGVAERLNTALDREDQRIRDVERRRYRDKRRKHPCLPDSGKPAVLSDTWLPDSRGPLKRTLQVWRTTMRHSNENAKYQRQHRSGRRKSGA